jgi:hypothetical protein
MARAGAFVKYANPPKIAESKKYFYYLPLLLK